MSLQNRRSTQPGHVPNLVSGEIAHNIPDDILFFRAGGWLTALNLGELRFYSLPSAGIIGAPLTYSSGGTYFDDERGPSSTIAGKVRVDDPPPAGQYGVPGAMMRGASSTAASLDANGVRIERFFVASTEIRINEMALFCETEPLGAIRIGVFSALGIKSFEHEFAAPALGLNTVTPAFAVQRGFWDVVIWSEAAVDLKTIDTHRSERSFNWASDNFQFRSHRAATHDLSAGLDVFGYTASDVNSTSPVEPKSGLLRWTQL